MNLGNILKQAGGTPLTGRSVEFGILVKDKAGNKLQKRCKALILPLGEDERVAALRSAQEWVDANPDYAGPFSDELRLHQIAAFLHDPDNPRVKFVLAEDFAALRSGLTYSQVTWLIGEYATHISEEYSELVSKEDMKKMEGQSEGFSGPAPGQSSES